MNAYQKPYTCLFNAITDALAAMEAMNFGLAQALLIAAQQRAEDQYINEAPD